MDNVKHVSEAEFDAIAAKAFATSDAAWQTKLNGFRMIYAELVEGYEIKEKGVFLSLAEFLPYYFKGWRGATSVNLEAQDALKLGYYVP